MFVYLQCPPVRYDDDPGDPAGPGYDVLSRQQGWVISAHFAVVGGIAFIGFLQRGIHRDRPGDARQFKVTAAHGDLSITCQRHLEHRFRKHTARVGQVSAGSRNTDVGYATQVEEGLAAEVEDEAPVRISPQDLLQRDLVDDAGLIEAPGPGGKSEFPAAL